MEVNELRDLHATLSRVIEVAGRALGADGTS
jgi:hypothetical protein